MSAIFNGKRWAATEEEILRTRVRELKDNYGITPRLVTILIGDDPASKLYVNFKKNVAEHIGCQLDLFFSERITRADLIKKIKSFNQDSSIHGIMVQLPLPPALQKSRTQIISTILPAKDVDGLRGNSSFLHPTAQAILTILEEAAHIPADSLIAIVGARGMVGRPLSQALTDRGYSLLSFNHTSDLAELKKADVIVSATGHPKLITADLVKSGVVIVDVGAPQGDVDFAAVSQKASFITPVPGGVGPVTIACLLANLIQAADNTISPQ